jgi:hypothetical protein
MSAAVQFGSVKQEQIIALRDIDEEPTQSLVQQEEKQPRRRSITGSAAPA